jgi:hypothetical protein
LTHDVSRHDFNRGDEQEQVDSFAEGSASAARVPADSQRRTLDVIDKVDDVRCEDDKIEAPSVRT